jgi:carboxyl-terminal processing protease
MKLNKIIIIISFFLFLNANGIAATNKNTAISTQQQRLDEVIDLIHKYYVDPVSDEKLFDSAIDGMLTKLDPHSSFLDAEDIKSLDVAISGKFEGIGITVVPDHGALKIISPIDNSPAQKAGLKAQDIIIRINNKLVIDMDPEKAINMMRGKRGTNVTLYVIRKNEEKPLKFVITRNVVNVQTVDTKLLDQNYGYVRIAVFYKSTADDLEKAIAKLQKQTNGKLNGIILDMRNNPGGLFDPAITIADDFLDAKKLGNNSLIVSIKGGQDTESEEFNATAGELLPKVPMVALINEGSASAAEIVAGALQEHKRAIIVGTKSFGKGSVQTVLPIDNNSAIKLTTSLYYTPNGRSIQAKGIVPDVVVPDLEIPQINSNQEDFSIYERDLENHIANGVEQAPDTLKQEEQTSLLRTDFQLYEALMILKGLALK